MAAHGAIQMMTMSTKSERYVVKLALKLIALALVVGLGAALYLGVKNRIGRSNAR